jgi:glycyl-tRNA synthetase beta subunit
LQLNNNARWKTDGDTRRNVTAMVEVMNDTTNIGNNRSEQLIAQMQDRIDTLVQQCKMKGPDHDALHLWLQQVKHDLKRIQEEGGEGYEQFYAALKRDVKSFYVYFE